MFMHKDFGIFHEEHLATCPSVSPSPSVALPEPPDYTNKTSCLQMKAVSMPDVFISYSRKDADFVRRLHGALANLNRDVWVDWEDIPLTADWWQEICRGIESADTFVLVVTPDALSSPVCALEIAHATQHQKRLIPIVRAEVDETAAFAKLAAHIPDDNLRKTLAGRDLLAVARDNWQAIARHNWLFFKDNAEFDSSFHKLMTAVDTDLDYVRQHTRVLVQAREWEAHGRESSYLLTGAEIREAEAFLAQSVNRQPRPTDLHAEYIVASQKADVKRQEQEQKLQRQARNRLRLLIGLLVTGILGIMGVFVWFATFTNDAAYELATQHLSSLAEIAARNINGDEFARWVREGARSPGQMSDDERYQEQAQWLYLVKASDPGIREVYTYIPSDEEGMIRLVASSLAVEENPPLDPPTFLESFAPPGRAQFIGLEETHVLPDVVEDANGVWFAGFSPIQNSGGQPVGAVGIDIRYDTYLRAPSLVIQVLQTMILIVAVIAVLGLVIFIVLRARRSTKLP
jgi:hypothetical protein